MAKYKTEKRKANVGERILITDATLTRGNYANGDVCTVIDSYSGDVYVKEHPRAILSSEYEVIVEAKPSKNERISLLESQVAELQAQVQALQKRRKPATALTQAPNEQRKATIVYAMAFVAKYTEKKGFAGSRYGVEFGDYVCDVEFIVNKEKRAVTVLAKGVNSGEVREKAIAKCAPDDVFNADIGKAIALGRALGLDVSEFENAVKPTEVVVGHKLSLLDKVGVTHTGTVSHFEYHYGDNCAMFKEGKGASLESSVGISTIPHIIDDTEAQY